MSVRNSEAAPLDSRKGGDDQVIEPTPDQLRHLGMLAERLKGSVTSASLQIDKEKYAAPAAALQALRLAVDYLARNLAVSIEPFGAILTTQKAADLLNVSRPYIVELIDQGVIPLYARTTGAHRRVRLADVLAFRDGLREAALSDRTEVAAFWENAREPAIPGASLLLPATPVEQLARFAKHVEPHNHIRTADESEPLYQRRLDPEQDEELASNAPRHHGEEPPENLSTPPTLVSNELRQLVGTRD